VLRTLADYNSAIPEVEDSWKPLARAEQLAMARDLGTITSAIHCLPQEDLAQVERQFGGRREYAKLMEIEQIAQIEATERLSVRQRDALLHCLTGEAQDFLDEPPKLTHSDFSHAHIYIARETDTVKVTGSIDWAEAVLGPPEWDIAFHWFWTFTRPRSHARMPGSILSRRTVARFARRYLSTHLYSF
jgi:aminoglycoside phosphotransferase (APT) family kinase protein